MEKADFIKRLTELRMSKGVSAQDMSYSIGMSHSYINRLENSVGLPTMENFFYICDYLGVTPKEFFDFDTGNPSKLSLILKEALPLSDEQLDVLLNTIRVMKK